MPASMASRMGTSVPSPAPSPMCRASSEFTKKKTKELHNYDDGGGGLYRLSPLFGHSGIRTFETTNLTYVM